MKKFIEFIEFIKKNIFLFRYGGKFVIFAHKDNGNPITFSEFNKLYGFWMCHDGNFYDLREWNKLLQRAKRIKIGDIVFNNYKLVYTTVKKIDFETWLEPENKITIIQGVCVLDSLNYCIYDPFLDEL